MNKGLLEKYSGAAAAFSVRLLNRTYTGPLLKIRRVDVVSSQDNGEIFVFPDSTGWISLDSRVDDPSNVSAATTLGEFVNSQEYTQPDSGTIGSNPQNAFVSIWKDQSGNANDASQDTTTSQPQIVSIGVVIVENGKPAVDFNNNYLSMTSDTSPLAGFMTINPTSVAGGRAYIGGSSSSDLFGPESTTGLRYRRSSTNYITSDLSPTGYHIFSFVGTGSSVSIYQDGTGSTDNPFSAGALSGINQIFRRQSLYIVNGTAQEIILYESNQSANRTNIEKDINTAFNIYSEALSPADNSLLGKYPGAAAAYSVRSLTGADKQPLLKARRELGTDTDTEEVIYAGSNGFLDQSKLLNFVNGVSEDPRLPLDVSEGYGYSLRVVKKGYSGPLIQVRESGGNTTKDIYADYRGNLDINALKEFCGSNNGFVSKWYNQSGVDRTLEATTSNAQPKIVEAGVVVRNSLSQVGIKFENSLDSNLHIDDTTFDLQEQNIVLYFELDGLQSGGVRRIIGIPQSAFNTSVRNTLEHTTTSMSLAMGNTSKYSTNVFPGVNSPSIFNAKFKGSDSLMTRNKAVGTGSYSSLPTTSAKGLSVGAALTAGSTSDMTVSEVIQYTSAQTGDNTIEIEASLNKHYKVYGDAYVSEWFDQSLVADSKYILDSNPGAAAAYSLRKLRENYTGKAINVRRDSDQNHLDIGFTSSGELDINAISNFCAGTDGFVTTWYNQAFNSTNELLLDTTAGAGAEAAYSVRQLSGSITECMVIQRSSDSKTRTIGFKNRDIDEAAIESFCTGTTCTVETWKDQSGNGNHATQTNVFKKPVIYTGGAITKSNGRVIVSFENGNSLTSTAWMSAVSPLSFTCVYGHKSNAARAVVIGVDTDIPYDPSLRVWNDLGGRLLMYNFPASDVFTTSLLSGNRYLISGYASATSVSYYKDGTGFPSNPIAHTNTTAITDAITIGSPTTYNPGSFETSEIIAWLSDKSGTNQTSIEENINGYYGVYSTNNVTQDTPGFQPKIYASATGIIKENGKPAVQFDGSDDELTSTTVPFSGTTHRTSFTVSNADTATSADIIYGIDGGNASAPTGELWQLTSETQLRVSGRIEFNSSAQTIHSLGTLIFNGTTVDDANFYLNGSLTTQGTSTGATINTGSTNFGIGTTVVGTSNYDGKIQELIFYASDESANRLEIEGNINSHYRIYGGNDASQTVAAAQPQLVATGRVILENGKPAVQFAEQYFSLTSAITPTEYSAAIVMNPTQLNFATFGSTVAYTYVTYYRSTNDVWFYHGNTGRVLANSQSTGYQLNWLNWTGSTVGIGKDGGTMITGALSGTPSINQLAASSAGGGGLRSTGTYQEMIFWATDQNAAGNRRGIESNINQKFGIYWDGSKRGILDDHPNAEAAYSVRALRSTYTGPLVEIRDASGNTLDVYALFSGDINENAINTFCAGTTCTIATWYDQSGNGNNATQSAALAQPTIYTGGALVKENGRLALDFDGSNDAMTLDSHPFTNANLTVFALGKQETTSEGILYNFGNGSDNAFSISFNRTANTYTAKARIGAANLNQGSTDNQTRGLYTQIVATSSNEGYKNGTQGTQNINGRTLFTANEIGSRGSTEFLNGTVQELIAYDSDKSSVRTDIEENINNYYNIYNKIPGNRLLNNYPGAAAAYSLRVLDSMYLGPLVRVRRDSDNVHADVYADFNREISIHSKVGVLSASTDPIQAAGTSSLKSFMNGANGFVAVWYDQSANGNDATNAQALQQPKIVTSGTVETFNGKPSVRFINASTTYLDADYTSGATHTYFTAHDRNGSNSNIWTPDRQENAVVADGLVYVPTPVNGLKALIAGELAQPLTAVSIQDYRLTYWLRSGADSELGVNGSSVDTGTQSTSVNGRLRLGTRAGFQSPFNGYFYEFMVYASDQSSNRTGIESNINKHYSIFNKQKKLLDAYGGAAAAYSLRRLLSNYGGPLVKIRRDSDNIEVNVYPDFEGNFSLNSIVTNVDETTTGSSQASFSYSTPYATLSQFVEGNPNCFVVEWKDQSTNNNHATQTAAASQPQIVSSGAVIVDANGKPRIAVEGTKNMSIGNLNLTEAHGFVLFEKTALGSYGALGTSQTTSHWGYTNGQIYDGFYNNARPLIAGSGTISANTPALLSMSHDGTMVYRVNATEVYNQAGTFTNATTITLKGYYDFKGYYQEIIIYPSVKSASDTTNIETNINTFYSIY